MKLVLPYPVSANDFMGSFVPKGHSRPIPFVTPEAKRYKRDVAYVARAAGWREPTSRLIEIGTIILHPRTIGPSGKRTGAMMDLDNVLKVTFDALKGVVYADDKQIKRIRGPIEYGEPSNHGGLVVEVLEFITPQVPLFKEEAPV